MIRVASIVAMAFALVAIPEGVNFLVGFPKIGNAKAERTHLAFSEDVLVANLPQQNGETPTSLQIHSLGILERVFVDDGKARLSTDSEGVASFNVVERLAEGVQDPVTNGFGHFFDDQFFRGGLPEVPQDYRGLKEVIRDFIVNFGMRHADVSAKLLLGSIGGDVSGPLGGFSSASRPRSSPSSEKEGQNHGHETSDPQQALKSRPPNGVFGRLSGTPLLAQISVLAFLGGVTAGIIWAGSGLLLLGRGTGFRLLDRVQRPMLIGGLLLGLGLLTWAFAAGLSAAFAG